MSKRLPHPAHIAGGALRLVLAPASKAKAAAKVWKMTNCTDAGIAVVWHGGF